LAYASASTLSFVVAIADVEVRTTWAADAADAAEAGATKISPAPDSAVAAVITIGRQLFFMITFLPPGLEVFNIEN